jgi:hypothetical protein
MNDTNPRTTDRTRRELGWPAAATLITALVGAAVTTVAWAIVPPEHAPHAAEYVSAREIGEVQARLAAIEESHRQMRAELRGDIHELRTLVQQLLKQ